jgi:hypothetical protein
MVGVAEMNAFGDFGVAESSSAESNPDTRLGLAERQHNAEIDDCLDGQ